MRYANKIPLCFLWISAPFIYCQQGENATAENHRISMNTTHETNVGQNSTDIGEEKNHTFNLLKDTSATKILNLANETKFDTNTTDISAEKKQLVLPPDELINGTKIVGSLNNTSFPDFSISPVDGVPKPSSMATSDVNYTLDSSPSKKVEFKDVNEMENRVQNAASSKLLEEIRLFKNSHNLTASANNLFKLVVPYIQQGNPRHMGVWKVPHEVLMTDYEGSDIIQPASVVESRSFITNPEISSVRLNLAFPETLNIPRIESRSRMSYGGDHPYYDNEEPYSSNESGEPPESGVNTETTVDDGRFLEDDYRQEIEKEAEAFVKRQKAQNATNDDKSSSAEQENPGSMENNYHNSVETEKGPEETETDSQDGYFKNQDGKWQTETNPQDGYFMSHNGNKVFFYKGKDSFFNIDDVFPLLKFDQPLIDDYPEKLYLPQNPTTPYFQMGHSEYPPKFLHTIDTHVQNKEHFHNEAPEIYSKHHSSMVDSTCTHEQEDVEQGPKSYPVHMNEEYHNSEPNYATNHQHSAEFEGEYTLPEYQDNGNYKHQLEPHILDGTPEYDSRENYEVHTPTKENHGEKTPQHNSNIAQSPELDYERQKLQVHQYKMQQKYQVELHEERSSLRKKIPKTPYHIHSESNVNSKPGEQIHLIEKYNDISHNQNKQVQSFDPNKPNIRTKIQNPNIMLPHNSNFMLHNQNKNSHSYGQQNQNEVPSRDQNIVPDNRNNIHFPPHNPNLNYVPIPHQNFKPPHIQNTNFNLPHTGNQNLITPQVENPGVQMKVNFHPASKTSKGKPDCHETELRSSQNHNYPQSFHEKHYKNPQSLAIAISRSQNLALGKGADHYNPRYPISTLMALASSENHIKETHPKKEGKKAKQKSHVKRSKARKRKRRNFSKVHSKKQKKTRRSTRDDMKAEAATYHWGLENHKDKDGFFMYANNPSEDDYEYGYRVGGPHQTLERHHRTEGIRSTIKLNWEDQNGDSGDQYWEFNHDSPEESSTEASLTAKAMQEV